MVSFIKTEIKLKLMHAHLQYICVITLTKIISREIMLLCSTYFRTKKVYKNTSKVWCHGKHYKCWLRVRHIRCGCVYLGHIACRPPSTGRWAPVVKLASSLARNAIALATSDTSPTLPRACVVLLRSKNCRDENVLESESITATCQLPVWMSAHSFLHFSFPM